MKQMYVSMVMEVDDDAEPSAVQLAVLAALSDRHRIVNTSVAVFGDDDDPQPQVDLVLSYAGSILRGFIDDPEGADGFARSRGAVVVSLTADADYRV